MQNSLLLTTLVMGLVGGPHCIAMCGAACGGITRDSQSAYWQFFGGRMLGYASLGAVAAGSVRLLAWLTTHSSILHPVWSFFHVLVLSWGIVLVLYARQPVWVNSMGRSLWQHVRQLGAIPGGAMLTGMLWALMPCGLLYSALMLASLSANPIHGALSMAAFATGSSISLLLGPWAWRRLKHGKGWISEPTGMRLAGLLLAGMAAWAVWMDLTHPGKLFCIS